MTTVKYKPSYAKKAGELYAMGATQRMLAAVFDVSLSTFERWLVRHPALRKEMESQGAVRNLRVSSALYDQATGYHYVEQETVKLKDANGIERVEVVDVKRYVKGVTSAAIYWLKNRQSESWADRREIEVVGLARLLDSTFDKSRGLPSSDEGVDKFREDFIH